MGCTHTVSLKERVEFEGPSELGGSSRDVSKSIKNFMKHFWFKFGRTDARSLAEARHATVRDLILSLLLILNHLILSMVFLLFSFLYIYFLFLCRAHRGLELNMPVLRPRLPSLTKWRAKGLRPPPPRRKSP